MLETTNKKRTVADSLNNYNDKSIRYDIYLQ